MASPIITHTPVFAPVDRLVKAILEERLKPAGINVTTQYSAGMPTPSLLVSIARGVGNYGYDSEHRFMRRSVVQVDSLTQGVDAKDDGHAVQEAAQTVLYEALHNSRVIPGLGHLASVRHSSSPSEVNDYATSSGAVQYASLPHDIVRLEMIYRVLYRPDHDQSRMDNPYLRFSPINQQE